MTAADRAFKAMMEEEEERMNRRNINYRDSVLNFREALNDFCGV